MEKVYRARFGDIIYCMKALLLSSIPIAFVLMALSCGPPPPVNRDLMSGLERYSTGIYLSDILRVPVDKDRVVCYVAVEANQLKSINCIKVESPGGNK